ncbi:DUF6090 family protein [Catalinimonas sp. 4WD22]|uniref:DUF6090 family protein n=1 Tax=Catalinimonas locisalis TaxID=3133978 RepID=UPI003100CEA2
MKKIRINVQWSDKFVDLIVVILGISIAFTLNNWNNNRQESKLRKKYLSYLYNDLKKDSLNLAYALEGIKKEGRRADSIIVSINWKSQNRGVEIGSLFSKVGDVSGSFSPENYTYRAMQQSGNIALLSDSLQILLGELNDEYENIRKQQETFEEIIFTYAVPIFFNYDDMMKVVNDEKLYYSIKFKNVILGISGNISVRRSKINKAKGKLNDVMLLIIENQD